MKNMQIAIFFAVFFTLYGLINFYIGLRGWQAVPAAPMFRLAYVVVFLVLALSFIAGRFLERAGASSVADVLIWVGSFWLAAMAYFFIAVVVIDLLRVVNHFIPLGPEWMLRSMPQVKLWLAGGVTTAVAVLLIAGHWNAVHPKLVDLRIPVAKPLGPRGRFVIAAASDIHLGTIIGNSRLDGIVATLNAQDADVILLLGDIVDEDLGPVISANLGEQLRGLRSRTGVYGITGNHEYIGGVDAAVRYLTEHGVVMLQDSSVVLPGGVLLVGRKDRSAGSRGPRGRKPLSELLAAPNPGAPIVLMDHQPFHLEEAEAAGVDLQLSGHTHHGQIWPLNYITQAVYEVSRGYLQKGATHYFVSTGVGTWGPPVRIGNRPEILRITLESVGN